MKAYIVKLTFEDIEPAVWRRVIMPAGATFNRLHEMIQHVTNFQSYWTDMAVHSFGVELEDSYVTDNVAMHEEYKKSKYLGKTLKRPTRIKIDSYLEEYSTLLYEYDFGDGWHIQVQLEEIVEDYYFGFPTLLAGEGDAPPEDVGGVYGYKTFLEIYHDPTHPEYLDTITWAESQNYTTFDIDWENHTLKGMNYKKTEWDHIHHERYTILSDKYRGSDIIDLEAIPNQKLVSEYIIACTRLYGIVPFQKLREIYNKQNDANLSGNELSALMDTSAFKRHLKEEHVHTHFHNFTHETVEVFNIFETLQKEAVGKPFYVPGQGELLKYSDEFYFERTPQQEQFRKMLENDFFGGNALMAGEEIEELVSTIQVSEGNHNSIIRNFTERFEFKDQQQLYTYLPVIISIMNTTRLWENRGHTPQELAQMVNGDLMQLSSTPLQVLNGGKVGRNDPCPCESGKKYKKCCWEKN
ncbi:SEC-C domain-containing protein [Viridibacillus sp. YIM B01967]|uniref:SEC-C domain-containing protein n=1 Tax=Viridibacillus soli TaxID=2798301 RepID=A0ABS1H9Z7_9BACL|nr:plasmid pRiA4b ORF-3 family protein [Viridibacillus soli]MBK3496252.1 SEC-C domain-containing protein [Viridibacillus soli]